jgi:hypothetical protein
MKILNLTPHEINIHLNAVDYDTGKDVLVLPKAEVPARCSVASRFAGMVGERGNVPTFITSYGDVTGLPDERADTLLVVSFIVQNACPDRFDLATPGAAVRDEDGKVIGCWGLNVRNKV